MNGYDLDIAYRTYPKVAESALDLPLSENGVARRET
jgi:hypothetical protein